LQAVLAGDVHIAFENIAVVLPLVRSGQLRALAVTTAQRTRALPELPTVAEQGRPDYAVAASVGLLAPAGTPDAVVQQLDAALQRGMTKDAMRQRIEALGMEVAVEGLS
jgi:tripartite-type tricarboxylate transporter receptor subunit TctC